MGKDSKPYEKPVVIRYGRIEELTRAGNPGGQMDHLVMGNVKTGF